MEFNETWQEERSQRPLQSLCFSGQSEKQDGRPCLWLAETFWTSPLKPLNRIQQNLTGRKISMSSTKFVFFGPIRKTRWPPLLLIGWDIFDFSFETVEQNSTKLDRKKDFNVLYQVCVFWADRKNKMAALASDWLRHFRLLLWNRWTACNETWQEERSQRPLPSLCFFGWFLILGWKFWSKKQDALANPSKRWHIVLRCTICGPLGLLFVLFHNNYVFVLLDHSLFLFPACDISSCDVGGECPGIPVCRCLIYPTICLSSRPCRLLPSVLNQPYPHSPPQLKDVAPQNSGE